MARCARYFLGRAMTADAMMETLKALRSQWLTAEALVFEVGSTLPVIRRLLSAGMQHGVLVSRQQHKPPGKSGFAAAEYTLSSKWGGQG
jgi:hypothetical protein